MSFCLPIEETKKFIQALKDGVIDPGKLAQLSSEDRRAFFEKIVGADDAKEVNAQFESKLLLKNQQQGMINWAKKLSGISESAKTDLVSRIERMDKVLSAADKQSFLQDAASKRLGTEVTFDEAQKITQFSKQLTDLKKQGTDSFAGVSDEYLKAKNELTGYIDSLKPIGTGAAIGKDLVTIGRNNLLLSPSTLLKTSMGQFVNSAIDFATRRLSTLSLQGENPVLARAASSEAWGTFRKTGVNVAGMENIDDTHILGKGESFKTTTGEDTNPTLGKVEGVIRKVAQISNKVAIDWQHVAPFTKVYQSAFYDMANILSSDLAGKEGLEGDAVKTRASDVFKDASRIEPQTDEGKLVRSQAQQQAARVTSTNETYASHFSLGFKKLLNTVGKPIGVPLGDLLLPIAKIPAVIFSNAVENAGVGLGTGAVDMIKGYSKISSPDITTRYEGMAQFQKGTQTLIRTAGSMVVALTVANSLKKSDFKQDNFGNNYVKFGNTWINLEYVAAVSPAIAGAMLAKQGTSIPNSVYKYGAGALSMIKTVPGIDEINQGITTGASQWIHNFVSSRLTPTFIQYLQQTRPINRLFFGAHGVETTQQASADNEATAKKSATTRANNIRAKLLNQ